MFSVNRVVYIVLRTCSVWSRVNSFFGVLFWLVLILSA